MIVIIWYLGSQHARIYSSVATAAVAAASTACFSILIIHTKAIMVSSLGEFMTLWLALQQ